MNCEFFLIKTEWTTLFTFKQSHFIKKISFQVQKTKLNVEEVQIQCNLIKLMYCWHRVSSLMTAFSHIRKLSVPPFFVHLWFTFP